MSIESSFRCSHAPAPREKGVLERVDEFLTFRAESLRKLEEKKLGEMESIRKETREACAKERSEFARNDFRKIDLSSLGKSQETIGRKGTVRKLLFGMNGDIIKNKGTIGAMDEEVLASCNKKQSDTPLCKELRAKNPEQIRLSGSVRVNFRRNLEEVWQYKMHDWSSKDTAPEIRAFYEKQVKPFTSGERDFTKISRKEYEKEVVASIDAVRKNADFNKGFALYGISTPVGLELAKAFEKRISEADLIALGITEIMDRNSPAFNDKVLTTILENAGKEYLMFFPAMGDRLLSYGPYQITRSAVDGKSGGATLADDRFTGGRTLKTRDISRFPLEDHHKAAYLLALTNIALLVKSIPSEHRVVTGKWKHKKTTVYDLQKTCLDLMKKGDPDMLNLFEGFIAGAHNRQDVAKKGVMNWLVARCCDNGTLKIGGDLKKHISKNGPATVGNNVEKQTGGEKWKGNRGMVLASLERK